MKIFGDRLSGNCYKINLIISILKIDHEWIDVDILNGDTKSKSFLEKNPNGKIPLLELTDGTFLSESNAILNYLANGSFLIPTTKFEYYKVQQWQFFEQYSHEPYIAVARFINKYLGLPKERIAEYESKQVGGHKALLVMENQLSQTKYLVGNSFTVADISLYAYTHVAHEGGFNLDIYPNIKLWLTRIESLDGYVKMI
jgi:glutathione S-transferase